MKIDRILYTHTYPIGMSWEKIGMEATIDDMESPKECLEKLKEEVHNFHRISNPQLYKNGNEAIVESFEPIPEVKIVRSGTDKITNVITNCTDIKTLESFKLVVKGKPELMDAYDKKMSELLK